MNHSQMGLLHLVSKALFNVPVTEIPDAAIKAEAQRQAVLSLIDPKAYSSFMNNATIRNEHAKLTTILSDIPFTTIKGFASAYYYPEPIRRTMGDVDFLVPEDRLDDAERRLLAAGFSADHETDIHRCFQKSRITYEMHSEVNGIPAQNQRVRELLSDTIETSRTVPVFKGEIVIPDDFHNGLICLLHILKHMEDTGIGLRHFCDWACLVNSVENFETVFRERFTSIGLWKCARIFSLAAVKYIGLPYQDWMGKEDDSILDDLMEEIMSSGNFGSYKAEKEANWFIDKQYSGSKFRGFFSVLNGVIRLHWPISKKYPVLYPLGWIFFPTRYAFRILIRKRKPIHLRSVIHKADTKNRLLTSLELFQ